jgi:membrane peptidoglycan carboxypeptidase
MAVVVSAMAAPWAIGAGWIASKAATTLTDTRCDVVEQPLPQRTTILARDGRTVIATLFVQDRTPLALADVPTFLIRALVATEDRRFFEHHGVDLRGLARAALHDSSGGGTQGGSTLTMQYVKQVRYYQATTDAQRQQAIVTDIPRKLADARCALDIEKRNTKSQILQKYLDIAFFGEHSYGIATAAENYFAVPVRALTLPQAAMLVGLVRAPSRYDPFVNPVLANQRRNEVLTNMVETGDLTRADADRVAATPIRLATQTPPIPREGCSYASETVVNAGFFCDYAVQWLATHGYTQQQLYSGGLRVVTTLDPKLQSAGQRAVWKTGLRPDADYALVMPSVDPATGDVTTMITTRRYGLFGQGATTDPLFTAAYAGAGSTYKYFTAVTALAAGAPAGLSITTPGNVYRTGNCASGSYVVHNAGSYPDTMPLSEALPRSSNTYFVAMEDQFFGCKLKPVVDTALALGMDRLRQPRNDTSAGSIAEEVVKSEEPTFTLGQDPTSALQLTGAFAAAVNDGLFCRPTPILRVTDPSGRSLPVKQAACTRVMSRHVARSVVTFMRADTHTGTAAGYFGDWYAKGGSDVAGKTGTDNDAADKDNSALWFVGMTPRLVSAAALVDPRSPKQTVHDLPHMPGPSVGREIFGAYASTYWLAAYGDVLQTQRWEWSVTDAEPGARPVPSVIGQERGAAAAKLKAAGFRAIVFPGACGSPLAPGTVGYQQPPLAVPGTDVSLCLSSGTAPSISGPGSVPVYRQYAPRSFVPSPHSTTHPPATAPPPAPRPPKPPRSRPVRVPLPPVPPIVGTPAPPGD